MVYPPLTNGAQDAAVYSVYQLNRYLCSGLWKQWHKERRPTWRNSVAANLTNGSNDAQASSVVVNNGNIYVAGGCESNGTQVQIDGKTAILSQMTDFVVQMMHRSECSDGSQLVNVYVAGYLTLTPLHLTKAKLWVEWCTYQWSHSSLIRTHAASVFVSGTMYM